MILAKDSITALASEGRCGTQVPQIDVVFSGALTSPRVNYPDEWFCWLKSDGVPCVGRQKGFLHLTETGWDANKDDIKKAFEYAIAHGRDRGETWTDFEKEVSDHFANVRKKVAKLIAKSGSLASQLSTFKV